MNPNFYQGNAVETHLSANHAKRKPFGFHKPQAHFTRCLVNRIFVLKSIQQSLVNGKKFFGIAVVNFYSKSQRAKTRA
jgi:hypothetical protein